MTLARLAANRVILTFILSVVLFWAFIYVMDPGHYLRDVFFSMAVGMAIVIVVRLLPSVVHITRYGRTDAAAIQTMVIFLTWTTLLMSRVLALVNDQMGRPAWIIEGYLPDFIAYSVMIVGLLQVLVGARDDVTHEVKYWWHMLVGVGIGALVTGVVLGATFF